jgi:hypothetical protein
VTALAREKFSRICRHIELMIWMEINERQSSKIPEFAMMGA